jgi:hypothetical protein
MPRNDIFLKIENLFNVQEIFDSFYNKNRIMELTKIADAVIGK